MSMSGRFAAAIRVRVANRVLRCRPAWLKATAVRVWVRLSTARLEIGKSKLENRKTKLENRNSKTEKRNWKIEIRNWMPASFYFPVFNLPFSIFEFRFSISQFPVSPSVLRFAFPPFYFRFSSFGFRFSNFDFRFSPLASRNQQRKCIWHDFECCREHPHQLAVEFEADGFAGSLGGAAELARFHKFHIAELEVPARQDPGCVKEVASTIMAFEEAQSEPVIREARVRSKVKPSPVIAGSLGGGEGGDTFRPTVHAAGETLERVAECLPQRFHDVSRD